VKACSPRTIHQSDRYSNRLPDTAVARACFCGQQITQRFKMACWLSKGGILFDPPSQQAVTPIMVVIQNRHWGHGNLSRADRTLPQWPEHNRTAIPRRVRLANSTAFSAEYICKLKCSGIADGRDSGQALAGVFPVSAPHPRDVCPLIEPAQLVMGRGIAGLKLQHRFKRVIALLNLAPAVPGPNELEVQRADAGFDFLRLLKSLDRCSA